MLKWMVAVLALCGVSALAAASPSFEACEDAAVDVTLASSNCLVVALPFDPAGESEGKVELFVRQFPAPDQSQRRGQVWLVAGGPGEAGAALYPMIDVFRQAFPDYDLIVPDHRGTGDSTRLCPEQEAADSPAGYGLADSEWGPCIASLYADPTRTHAFSITNAAHDLAALIEQLRAPGQVHVYSVSYGTQLVLRMMQLAPPEIDSLVFDGLVPPESEPQWDLGHRTRIVDIVGRSILTSEQIGRYRSLLASDSPPWQSTMPEQDLRQFLGALLNFPALRDRIPELIETMLEGELDLLEKAAADLQEAHEQLTPYPQSVPSLPLVMLISASENNSRRDLTAETVAEEAESALFTSPIPGFLVNTPLPLYDRDEYFGQVPTKLPRSLVIQGTLDPNTPYEGARAHTKMLAEAGDTHFTSITNGAHLLALVAPDCFIQVVSTFIAGDRAPETCLAP